jgi:hypothetical protein
LFFLPFVFIYKKNEKNDLKKRIYNNVKMTTNDSSKDISGYPNVADLYTSAVNKNWIKLIPMGRTAPLSDYNKRGYFVPVADIVLDRETFGTGAKEGRKKRNTLIQFLPTISPEEFKEKTEWLYLFAINCRIVKIGGTRTGLKGRVASYLCGHHIKERGKSGDCSKTNGFIYNTFDFYLNLGCKVQMFGYKLPKVEQSVNIFGEETKITVQTYHAYESKCLNDYKKTYNEYPILSDNCDPEYK